MNIWTRIVNEPINVLSDVSKYVSFSNYKEYTRLNVNRMVDLINGIDPTDTDGLMREAMDFTYNTLQEVYDFQSMSFQAYFGFSKQMALLCSIPLQTVMNYNERQIRANEVVIDRLRSVS